jgi:hypothetical protein
MNPPEQTGVVRVDESLVGYAGILGNMGKQLSVLRSRRSEIAMDVLTILTVNVKTKLA